MTHKMTNEAYFRFKELTADHVLVVDDRIEIPDCELVYVKFGCVFLCDGKPLRFLTATLPDGSLRTGGLSVDIIDHPPPNLCIQLSIK